MTPVKTLLLFSIIAINLAFLNGCGGSGGSGSVAASPAAAPTNLTFSGGGPRELILEWDMVRGADHYCVLEDLQGTGSWTIAANGADIVDNRFAIEKPVLNTPWGTSQYIVTACNSGSSVELPSSPTILPSSVQNEVIGYFKASNTETDDGFGASIALSADGRTLAVSASREGSNATGINGDQTNNSATNSGAVYVFTCTGTTWSQQAYIKASNTAANDSFGNHIALSDDGNTLAVGASNEDSSATGINGDQTDNGATNSGAVYIFTRSGSTWSQQAYIKASNTGAYDYFARVALSGDGNTLAVGAYNEDSSATGINGDETDNGADGAGAVYVFTRSGTVWAQQAYIKASNTESFDNFGFRVAISSDGNTLAVRAADEASNAIGINGDETDNSAAGAGAVYVFTRSGTTWSQQAYIKASNTEAGDAFGSGVSISADGNTLAVSATGEDSSAIGINGDETNNSAASAGALYLFTRSGTTWLQQAYIKASNTEAGDQFGGSVALSADGNTLAVGAFGEDSGAIGINGNEADNSVTNFTGAVYTFFRSGTTWTQRDYIKATNTGADDVFGNVCLSDDGGTLAVGASGEDSAATGVDGNQYYDSAASSGAVYLY